jgi:hypothetical protein
MEEKLEMAEDVAGVEDKVTATKTSQKKKSDDIQLSLDQYFTNYATEVHPYTQAFVSADYHGILKTREEWEKELIGKV